jgi:hypothetical protein
MLCEACFDMLRRQEGRIWKGTYDLHFNHHANAKALRRSKEMNCGICRVLFDELRSKMDSAENFDDLPIIVTASLSIPDPRVDQLYRLDFKLQSNQIRCQRTFVLKEASKKHNPTLNFSL